MGEIRHVLLPCETKAREFDSKLLLACMLAEKGFTSTIGSRNLMHMQLTRFPQSLYLGKDVRYSSLRIMQIIKGLGHHFLAQDEEAHLYYSRERYILARVHPKVFQAAELLFAWGPDNARAWRSSPSYSGTPIIESGNGRIDLLRPELRGLFASEAARLKEAHGEFLLINTNFGSLNHFYSNLTSLKPPDAVAPLDESWEAGLSRHRYAIFYAFLKLLPELARRYPDHKIILRPHPSENHETWREAAGGHSNVQVTNEGSAIPWILASRALVHNGCTTGLEAYVLDALPVVYQPVTSALYDLDLTNSLGIGTQSPEQLFAVLDNVLAGKLLHGDAKSPERDALLRSYTAAVDGELASQRIANAVLEFARTHPAPSPGLAARFTQYVHSEARAATKRWYQNKPGHKSNIAYTRHRFPRTYRAEVESRVADFSRLLGRFEQVRVSDHSEDLFVISPSD